MNISNVSATNSAGTNSKYDSAVKALQKQKDDLTKQVAEVKVSKLDSKIKAEKIKNLATQIADIDQQIMQAKLDAQQKQAKEAQEKNAEKAEVKKYERELEENNQGVVLSPSLNKLITANKNSTHYKTMHAVRRRLKGEMAVSQGEISNAHNGSVQYQMDVISGGASKVAALEHNMVKKVDELQKSIKTSFKLGIKEAEKTREHKVKGKEVDKQQTDVSTASDKDVVATAAAKPTDDVQDIGNVPEVQKEKADENNRKKHEPVDVTV